MRLYHHPFSFNARRAVMTALHLGAPVELVFVDLQKGEQRQPEFLQLNPNHRVPVLEDDGFVLWESYAIMQYLADRTPRQALYPTESRSRADVNRWLFWSGQHFSPAIGILNWEHLIKGMLGLGAADAAEVRRGEQLVREFAGVLDVHLRGRDWICGEALSLADIAIATPLAATVPARLPVTDLPDLQRWFAGMQALEAWKKTAAA
ncbi:MAG TPA: glutathione S-transferase family protein [Steroidobacteraceae bacterium]|jgi:glutathione S-transferase|nr:glutathione S-transferase family protein [Steroidobacteraceae bacterium]